MTINADDERAVLADKRQIYSKYHASLDDVFTIANILRTEHGPDRPKYLSELQAASVTMFNATSDVRLTAPAGIASLARKVADTLSGAAGRAAQTGSDVDQDNAVYDGRQELYDLMRADLGVLESGTDIVPAKTLGEAQQSGKITNGADYPRKPSLGAGSHRRAALDPNAGESPGSSVGTIVLSGTQTDVLRRGGWSRAC